MIAYAVTNSDCLAAPAPRRHSICHTGLLQPHPLLDLPQDLVHLFHHIVRRRLVGAHLDLNRELQFVARVVDGAGLPAPRGRATEYSCPQKTAGPHPRGPAGPDRRSPVLPVPVPEQKGAGGCPPPAKSSHITSSISLMQSSATSTAVLACYAPPRATCTPARGFQWESDTSLYS